MIKGILSGKNIINHAASSVSQVCVLYDCLLTVKAAPHECVIRTGQPYAQVTHSRTGRRISHGYNPASFVAIRIGP